MWVMVTVPIGALAARSANTLIDVLMCTACKIYVRKFGVTVSHGSRRRGSDRKQNGVCHLHAFTPANAEVQSDSQVSVSFACD